jgi:hypothetical protein
MPTRADFVDLVEDLVRPLSTSSVPEELRWCIQDLFLSYYNLSGTGDRPHPPNISDTADWIGPLAHLYFVVEPCCDCGAVTSKNSSAATSLSPQPPCQSRPARCWTLQMDVALKSGDALASLANTTDLFADLHLV